MLCYLATANHQRIFIGLYGFQIFIDIDFRVSVIWQRPQLIGALYTVAEKWSKIIVLLWRVYGHVFTRPILSQLYQQVCKRESENSILPFYFQVWDVKFLFLISLKTSRSEFVVRIDYPTTFCSQRVLMAMAF